MLNKLGKKLVFLRFVLDIYLKGFFFIECLLVFKKLIEVFLND